MFTFLTADQPEVSNRGRVFSLGEICADDFELQHVRTGGNYRFGAVSLIPKDFAAACKAIVGCELDVERSTQFISHPKVMGRFLSFTRWSEALPKPRPNSSSFLKLFGHLISD